MKAFILDCKSTANITKNTVSTKIIEFGYGIRFTSCQFDSLTPANIVNNFIQIHGNSTSTSLSSCVLIHDTKNVNV